MVFLGNSYANISGPSPMKSEKESTSSNSVISLLTTVKYVVLPCDFSFYFLMAFQVHVCFLCMQHTAEKIRSYLCWLLGK